MNKILKEKIMEAFSSVLPITVIVLVASVVLVPMPSGTILMFMAGAALLTIGMGFFTLGADMALMPMGEGMGIQLTKSSKLILIILVSFVMGTLITIAEPDVQVLGRQVPTIPDIYLILTVAVGVGISLVIAVLRPFLKIKLSALLIVFYVIAIGLAYFTPADFVPVSFDSGGVTTGPITVPFILAMGVGLASIRSDRNSQDDTFGLVALCSVGPIIAVQLLGIFLNPGPAKIESFVLQKADTSREVVEDFAMELPQYLNDVLFALGAIVFCFIVFQLLTRRFKGRQIGRIIVGFIYTLIGLVLFLTGVNVGFFPVGELLGAQLASSPLKWILIPLGALVGYFIIAAEPAVHVLVRKVEEISSGAITQKMMNRGLAAGMAVALTLTMIRILFLIPLMWILIPGYTLALALTFFVPRIITGIAFDSGGVCSGPMTTTFLLPLAMGTCDGVGGDLMKDAFGVIAIVAMTPLIVIQLMGLVYQYRSKEELVLAEKQAAAIGSSAGGIVDWGAVTVFEVEG